MGREIISLPVMSDFGALLKCLGRTAADSWCHKQSPSFLTRLYAYNTSRNSRFASFVT